MAYIYIVCYYIHSVAVVNGDESYIDGPKELPSSTNSFIYQPLIPRINLIITLTAVFTREINTSLSLNASIEGNGMYSGYL